MFNMSIVFFLRKMTSGQDMHVLNNELPLAQQLVGTLTLQKSNRSAYSKN